MAVSPDRHRIAGEYLDRARQLTDTATEQVEAARAHAERMATSTAHIALLARSYGWTDKQISRRLGISRRDLRALLREHEQVTT